MSAAGSRGALVVAPDVDALARRAADWLVRALETSDEPAPAVALSGGATPEPLYRLLATPRYRDAIAWSRVHWFWGDERFVPPDHEASNYRMARAAMLAHVPVPEENVHPVPTRGLDPQEAARRYEAELTRFHGATLDTARPLFAANIMGLGEDGHTASLLPGTMALDERTRWVVAVEGVKAEPRITLTFPALESSRHLAVLVSGAAKRDVLRRALDGDASLPAARLAPTGPLTWFADREAAPEEGGGR